MNLKDQEINIQEVDGIEVGSNVLRVRDLLELSTTYVVPIFQRSYSWKKLDQVQDFWDDLIEVYKSKENYFIGPMVFTPEANDKLKILDGQQRFATFLLFLAALRDSLSESNIETKQDRMNSIDILLSKPDTVTLEKRSKLQLNREDAEYFQDIVISKKIYSSKIASHKLILAAYQFFREKIQQKIDDGEQFIAGILDALLNKFLIIHIRVNTVANAHALFEGLNDRGRALTVADLVKNYVLSLSEQNLDANVQQWSKVVDEVKQTHISRFLRYYWISTHAVVKNANLYKAIKKEVKSSQDVNNFLKELSIEADIYANLNEPTYEFWQDRSLLKLVEDLNVLRVDQIKILILALHAKYFDPNKKIQFRKIFDKLVNFAFRYNTVAEDDPKRLEREYHRLAKAVRGGNLNPEQVIEELRAFSPNKEIFVSKFKSMQVKDNKLSKYILLRIDKELLNRKGQGDLDIDRDIITLEHIIPQSPTNQEWRAFFQKNDIAGEQEQQEWIYSLGNMALINGKWNRDMSNHYFDFKQAYYKQSNLPITMSLADVKDFNIDVIRKRQQIMADVANNLWVV